MIDAPSVIGVSVTQRPRRASAATTGVVFPGQGVQFAGMGASLIAHSPAARECFEEASDHLGYDIAALCADPERIDQLDVAQPAILVCSVAAFRAAVAGGEDPAVVIGHSLGEYAAMVAAEALSFDDALRLVSIRARETAAVAHRIPGAMTALIGIGWDEALELCEGIEGVWIANDNHPRQVVASGLEGAIETLEATARSRRIRSHRLAVDGAFHCPLMEPAAEAIHAALSDVSFHEPSRVIISSTSAIAELNPERLAWILVEQLTGPVRFTPTLSFAWMVGIRRLIECGPKPVLGGLVSRMDDAWEVESISEASDLPAPAPA